MLAASSTNQGRCGWSWQAESLWLTPFTCHAVSLSFDNLCSDYSKGCIERDLSKVEHALRREKEGHVGFENCGW